MSPFSQPFLCSDERKFYRLQKSACDLDTQCGVVFFRREIISPGHRNWQLKTAKYDVVCVFFFLFHTEDLHHQGNCGYRRRQQKQLGGAVRHHHQCEEPASAVGEGQLQRGYTRKHRPRHAHRGTLGRGAAKWNQWLQSTGLITKYWLTYSKNN